MGIFSWTSSGLDLPTLEMAIHIMHSKKPNKPNKPYSGTQSILRVLSILKAFTQDEPELSLLDLTAKVGLNKTTVYRILTALIAEEMVTRIPATGNFRLGPEVIAMGRRAAGSLDLRNICRPELQALARLTRETSTLEVIRDADVLMLDEVQGRHVLGQRSEIGQRWPIHATSTGKVLLAHLSSEERDGLLPNPLERLTKKTVTSKKKLLSELAKIRKDNYAVTTGELELWYVGIGSPIRDSTGDVVAALSVGGPETRLSGQYLSQVIDMVVESAERVSALMGYKVELP